MLFRPKARLWQAVWWLVVLAVVVGLKHYYSNASAGDLGWIFRPLALLLEWFTGFSFYQDSSFEWVSPSANIRLVKSCAGVNFMIMSFLCYSWTLRPDNRSRVDLFSNIAGQTMLLIAAFIAAWATCLLANSLRIIIAMTVADQGWDLSNIGIGIGVGKGIGVNDKQVHRLIGMLVYIPLLSLQIMLGDRANKKRTSAYLIAPISLYAIITVLIPIITGNAWQKPAMFLEHVYFVLLMASVVGAIWFIKKCISRPIKPPT